MRLSTASQGGFRRQRGKIGDQRSGPLGVAVPDRDPGCAARSGARRRRRGPAPPAPSTSAVHAGRAPAGACSRSAARKPSDVGVVGRDPRPSLEDQRVGGPDRACDVRRARRRASSARSLCGIVTFAPTKPCSGSARTNVARTAPARPPGARSASRARAPRRRRCASPASGCARRASRARRRAWSWRFSISVGRVAARGVAGLVVALLVPLELGERWTRRRARRRCRA